jgi:hypothetical protein
MTISMEGRDPEIKPNAPRVWEASKWETNPDVGSSWDEQQERDRQQERMGEEWLKKHDPLQNSKRPKNKRGEGSSSKE